jgi:ribosomal protein S18 acetylase RimI-like enzyme
VNITLRNNTPEDFDTLHEIDQLCYEGEVAYSKRELRAYLRFRGSECVVAEVDGEIAGFCISARQGERGYIVTIDVLPQFRRLERRLADNGVREVALETATDNESAISFWNKHGYRSRGVRENYYPHGRDAFAMVKLLG